MRRLHEVSKLGAKFNRQRGNVTERISRDIYRQPDVPRPGAPGLRPVIESEHNLERANGGAARQQEQDHKREMQHLMASTDFDGAPASEMAFHVELGLWGLYNLCAVGSIRI
jgi:hypothetical protein